MNKAVLKVKLLCRKRAVDRRLLELVDEHAPGGARKILKAAVCESGMRFRPLLALTVCDALGGNWKNALDVACAIEFLHKASLVHDDIVDDDELRRGKPTLWKLYGKKQAVIAADLLIGICFKVASLSKPISIENRSKIITCLSNCLVETAYGEIEDLKTYNGKQSSTQNLESIMYNKSGSLISNSMQIGSILAGLNEGKISRVKNIGYELGYLFQMLNDLEDSEADAIYSKGKAGLDIERNQINLVTLCIKNSGVTFDEYLELDSRQKASILKPVINLIDTAKHRAEEDTESLQCSKFSKLINIIIEHFVKSINKYELNI